MFTQKFLTAGLIALVIVSAGLVANTVLLNNRVTQLEKYPVKIKIIETATPTSSPSATPTFYFKKITPTLKVK